MDPSPYRRHARSVPPPTLGALERHTRQRVYLHQLQQMAGAAPGAHGVYYSFPLSDAQDGSYFVDTPGPSGKVVKGDNQANCATFPAQVGIELPEQSGNLRYDMPALAEQAQASQASS